MIMIEAPSLVNLPRPSNANGQIPAHTSELANPNKTTNQMERSVWWPKKTTFPCVKIMSNVNIIPNTVHNRKAFTWLIYFGMVIMPSVYPHMVANNVYEGKDFASINEIFMELA
jgi:hypothetical protein